MTKNLNKGCNASNHPYGSAKEPKVQEYIIQTEDTYDERSMSQLIYLIKEKDRMIKFLQAKIDFLNAQEDVRREQLKDWRYHCE